MERTTRQRSGIGWRQGSSATLSPAGVAALALSIAAAAVGCYFYTAHVCPVAQQAAAAADWAASSPLAAQIDRDLKPFLGGISREMVEAAACAVDVKDAVRVQVVDGEAWVSMDGRGTEMRGLSMKLQLQEVLNQGWRIPDVDFVLDWSDSLPLPDKSGTCGPPGPVIAGAKTKGHWQAVLAPDFTFMGWYEAGTPRWEHLRGMMGFALRRVRWEHKKEELFFRGPAVGSARETLFRVLQHEPSIHLDVKDAPFWEVAQVQHPEHRYLLHVPGATTSSRLKWLMLTNSTVVLAASPWYEFWYDGLLREGVNYIPCGDLTSEAAVKKLGDIVESLEADQAKAQRIAAAALDAIQGGLTPQDVLYYWHTLLVRYAALQRFQPKVAEGAKPLGDSMSTYHRMNWSR